MKKIFVILSLILTFSLLQSCEIEREQPYDESYMDINNYYNIFPFGFYPYGIYPFYYGDFYGYRYNSMYYLNNYSFYINRNRYSGHRELERRDHNGHDRRPNYVTTNPIQRQPSSLLRNPQGQPSRYFQPRTATPQGQTYTQPRQYQQGQQQGQGQTYRQPQQSQQPQRSAHPPSNYSGGFRSNGNSNSGNRPHRG